MARWLGVAAVAALSLSFLGCHRPSPQEIRTRQAAVAQAQELLKSYDTRDWPEWYRQAILRAAEAGPRGKVRLWRKVAAQHDNAAPWAYLAEALYDTRDYEGAVKAADQALRVDPHHWCGYVAKAHALCATGRDADALDVVKQGMAPEYAEEMGSKGWWGLSQWLFCLSSSKQDHYASALEVANRLTAQRLPMPGATLGHALRAGAYWMRGDTAEAQAAADAGIKFDPYSRVWLSFPDLELVLCLVRLDRGERDPIEPLRRAEMCAPYPVVSAILATDAAKRGRWREALVHLEIYALLDAWPYERYAQTPLFPAERVLLGRLETVAGANRDRAKADQLVLLGLIEKLHGDTSLATAAIQAATRIEPQHKLAAALLSGTAPPQLAAVDAAEVKSAMRKLLWPAQLVKG